MYADKFTEKYFGTTLSSINIVINEFSEVF